MLCNSCGNQIPDNVGACPHCGAPTYQPQPNNNQPNPGYQPQPNYNQPNPGYQPQPNYNQPNGYPQPNYNQPQPPYGQPNGYNNAPVKDTSKTLAIVSLVLGILSFFCFGYISGAAAVVLGIVAKNKGYTGPMATAGIICGAVGFVLTIASQILLLGMS